MHFDPLFAVAIACCSLVRFFFALRKLTQYEDGAEATALFRDLTRPDDALWWRELLTGEEFASRVAQRRPYLYSISELVKVDQPCDLRKDLPDIEKLIVHEPGLPENAAPPIIVCFIYLNLFLYFINFLVCLPL